MLTLLIISQANISTAIVTDTPSYWKPEIHRPRGARKLIQKFKPLYQLVSSLPPTDELYQKDTQNILHINFGTVYISPTDILIHQIYYNGFTLEYKYARLYTGDKDMKLIDIYILDENQQIFYGVYLEDPLSIYIAKDDGTLTNAWIYYREAPWDNRDGFLDWLGVDKALRTRPYNRNEW